MSQSLSNAATTAETHIENQTSDSIGIFYITADKAVFKETPGHILSLSFDGKDYPRVHLHRSFPHSNSDKFIAVRDPDNKEIGMIKDIGEFDEDVIEVLQNFMQIRYFAPVITKINNVKDEFGYTFWDVRTTQGDCRFVVRKDTKSVMNISDKEIVVVDVDGNRFTIPDLGALSEKELKLIELYI